MVKDYSKYPCGADGLSFPNGLPEPNTVVSVKTVWSNDEWERVYFKKVYAWERQYSWFSVYGIPRVDEGSMPIVLEWKEF
jgi:hypothetical protein